MKTLRLILGDQLNQQHSWFSEKDSDITYVMAEMRQETDYVKHHIQKVVAFFLSMRNFADFLKSEGHIIKYYKITDKDNPQELTSIISEIIIKEKIEKFEYQLPDEYRLDLQLSNFCEKLEIESQAFDSEHFYTSRMEVADFFKGKKSLLMESFYREMRKKHSILTVGDQPLGGKWNFDQQNRNKYKEEVPIPIPLQFGTDVSEVVADIETAKVKTFGTIDADNFQWPTSRKESEKILNFFCDNLLEHFGTYQDSLYSGHKYLFHSRLSFAMNSKMISPKEVIDQVIVKFQKNQDKIEISQIEGFVRQILGWREYMCGIYWKEMPDYKEKNALNNTGKLPDYFWTGKTKMKCMQHALSQSLDSAYAHHIQRLMVIGNFCLLTQTHPDQVDEWYLGVYIDAIEWVELPNTRGMSQYADGGIVATKPYVSSGSYINKMSNYCSNCSYNVKEKVTDNACPFNSLYWHLLDEKKEYFQGNHRMSMMMSLLKKMKPSDLAATKEKAISVLKNIENL